MKLKPKEIFLKWNERNTFKKGILYLIKAKTLLQSGEVLQLIENGTHVMLESKAGKIDHLLKVGSDTDYYELIIVRK